VIPKVAVVWDVALPGRSNRLHGATSQKTAIFIFVALRTWNPKKRNSYTNLVFTLQIPLGLAELSLLLSKLIKLHGYTRIRSGF
jgi:hypothetical protein